MPARRKNQDNYISKTIVELVEDGMTGTNEVKHSLEHFVHTTVSTELGRKPLPGIEHFTQTVKTYGTIYAELKGQ